MASIAGSRYYPLCVARAYPKPGGDSGVMMDQVQAGIVATRRGQRQEARELFQQALRENLQNEQVWLWMSLVVDSPAEKQVCLERALFIDPNNQGARVELEKIAAISARNELTVKPLSRMDLSGNGGRATLPFDVPATNVGRPIVQPLPDPDEDQPLRTVAADFVSSRSLPPQLLREEHVPPWVAASEAASTSLPVEEASVTAQVLTVCLSATAVSGLLVLGVLWLLGW